MLRARQHLDQLYSLIEILGEARELDALLRQLPPRLARVLNAERATLYLVDEHTNELWSRVPSGDGLMEIRLKPGQGLAGWVGQARAPVLIEDVLLEDRFDGRWDQKSGFQTRNMLAVPLLNPSDELVGVLQVLNKRRGGFNLADQRLLRSVAVLCAARAECWALKRAAAEHRCCEMAV